MAASNLRLLVLLCSWAMATVGFSSCQAPSVVSSFSRPKVWLGPYDWTYLRGYRYVDRPLPGSTAKIDRRRSIEGEIDRRRSVEGEKGKKKKKRRQRRKKKKRGRRKKYFALSPPVGRPRTVAALTRG
ncbi:hypothetical protein B296_00057648 [Ensete ventricosum]|uniref:Uncharacterized protein n=1 Tax=Ensete ventricosum TaxID=4639 RepID=A0A426XQ88_ENSVE|nr:hypothetical protein B296_00057648 [Ensete ventricosum]